MPDCATRDVQLCVRRAACAVRGPRARPKDRNARVGRDMLLAKVVGTVVSTRKEASLNGLKLMLVRPVDTEGKPTGQHLVAADAVGAGPDEMVLIAAGSSARQTQATDKRPVDAVIMAIVDSWTVDEVVKYKK